MQRPDATSSAAESSVVAGPALPGHQVSRRKVSWHMRLPFAWLLALRYLRSSRRDAFVRLLSILAAGGIALGVSALVLVLAALEGLQGFLREDVLARTPHLEVELLRSAAMEPAVWVEEVRRLALETEGVESASPMLRGRGWLLLGSRPMAVELLGFVDRLPAFFPDASEHTPGLYVGRGLAATWGLEPGMNLELISPRPTLTPLGPQPRSHRLTMQGTFREGRTEDEAPRVALPLAAAEGLLGKGRPRLELVTQDLATALKVARDLKPRLPEGSQLRTWQDLNRGLFLALRLERTLMFLAVFLVVPVAALALVTVLVLLIASKRREIAMLEALGAERGALRRAFLLLGGGLALAGLLMGLATGIGGALVADRYQLIAPPGDVYYLSHVPFQLRALDLLLVSLSALGLTLGATVWAARRAAEEDLVGSLRRRA